MFESHLPFFFFLWTVFISLTHFYVGLLGFLILFQNLYIWNISPLVCGKLQFHFFDFCGFSLFIVVFAIQKFQLIEVVISFSFAVLFLK